MTTFDPTPESTTTSAAATSERSTISADDIAARARDIAATTAQRTWTGFSSLSRPQQVLVVLGHLLFWPFNLFFGSTAVLGYMPIVLLDLLLDAFAGLVPWAFAIGAVLLAAVPVASIVGGLLLALRRDGRALLVLLFGVEIPALWLLMSRTFGMQELSGAASTLIVGATIGLAALYARTIDTSTDDARTRRLLVTQPFVAVLVPIALFVIAVFGIGLALPALLDLIDDMFTSTHMLQVMTPVFLVVVVGFFGAPFVGPVVWVVDLVGGARALRRRHGLGVAAALTVGPTLAFVAVVASQWSSPAETTLARFAELPKTDDERRALLADKEDIRAGLVDAALLTHRYPFGNGHPWRAAWSDVVGHTLAEEIDDELRLWAAPFVYDGDIYADPSRAQQLYRDFFGDELERAERDAVKKAMSATFTREQRFAGLINQGEQRVRLVNQTVTATPTDHGTVVVEVHDEWSNLTPTDLEIQLMFSLPPTAAVTGLWLNDVDDKQQAFPFALAPRGAAQQVYREQVQRRVDPALLEQVGPQQYRLRVFPVPARAVDGDRRGVFGFSRDAWSSTAGKHAHVWLTYETIAVDGVVPVPMLLEARNAFFDDVATRSVQGARVANDDTQWVPSAPRIAPAATTPTTFKLADDRCVDVTDAPAAPVDFSAWRGKRVDVVIDRSLAIDALREPLSAALNAMRSSGAQFETVWTTSMLRNEAPTRSTGLPADVSTLLAFGRTPLKTMIGQQRTQLRLDGGPADVVVVLAARGSFESNDDAPLPIEAQRAELLVLHLGDLPTGYDDATADAVALSGGIITSSLSELAAHVGGDDGALIVGTGSGARRVQWASCTSTTTPASSLVARLAIRLIDATRDRSDASTIDGLHRIALSVPVVTPYSSMIVLVNEEQRERLRQLAQQEDRYDREVESGLQSNTNAPALMVTGAPEPHEWALLTVALFAVAIATMHRRRQSAQ